MTDLDSDDFRDRHERAMRGHIIGGPTDHDCDDLCSAAIIDRLVGKTPINEYPLLSSPETTPAGVLEWIESLRSPRNSLGLLALPKGPMEWAVQDAWDKATEPVGDPADGIEMHSLSKLADAILDALPARLSAAALGRPGSDR